MKINDIKELIRQVINEEYHRFHPEYRMLEGNDNINVAFNDGSKLQFEVHFRNNHGIDKDNHRKKAASKWRSLASKIHNDTELNEVGNPQQLSWKESFKLALKDPELKEYIRNNSHQKVFGNKDVAPCIDSVNFTKTG
jgi:hypothetical protein